MSVSAYAASRSVPSGNAAGLPLYDVTGALPATTSRFAATEMIAALQSEANPLVSPPLVAAHAALLGEAAQGATLTQIQQGMPTVIEGQLVLRHLKDVVTRNVWGQAGRKFAITFLDSTLPSPDAELSAYYYPTTAWTGQDTRFAEGEVSDATDQLKAAHPDLGVYNFGDKALDVRLLVADSIQLGAHWNGGSSFDGIYVDEAGTRRSVPMVRFSQGVTRYSGTDYTANVFHTGSRALVTIIPSQGSLQSFAQSGLEDALREISGHLFAAHTDGGPPPGEIVLPTGTLKMPNSVTAPLARAGISLPYDEVNANLRGLDLAGGTYAQTRVPDSLVKVDGNSITIQSAAATGFIFDSLNKYGGPTSGIVTTIRLPEDVICDNGSSPDMRSVFLVVYDSFRTVLSLAAVRQLKGTPLTSCQATVAPW